MRSGASALAATVLLAPLASVGCGSDEPGPVAAVSTVSQRGITWGFDREVTAGQFANGDYWVVGPVTLVSISPDAVLTETSVTAGICDGWSAGNEACVAHCAAAAPGQASLCTDDELCLCGAARHGWEVNPTYPGGQGLDDRAGHFDGRLVPTLPYLAAPGQSIVKVVSLDLDVADCRPCVAEAGVLTVLGEAPPDGGATSFRPPYVGNEKPLVATSSLRTELLPRLAPVADTPTLAAIQARFGPLQLDHKTGFECRRLHPRDHMPDYGCDVGRDIGDGVLRLMLDEPAEEKIPALVPIVQYGIDAYYAARLGRDFASGCDGHQTGYKLLLTFAATLLDDDAMRSVAADPTLFEEDVGIYESPETGRELYGYGNDYWSEQGYWGRIAAASGSRSHADPYGLIDGGEGLSNYQGIVSPTWKGEALALHLMPELAAIWPSPLFLRYVDRWVNFGFFTQPDPCAPVDGVCAGGDHPGAACTSASAPTVCTGSDAFCDGSGNWDPDGSLGLDNHYGVTYGSDGSGGCILDQDSTDGTGRFPQNHGAEADGPNRRSAFQGALWDAYRGPSCYDGSCNGAETPATCAADCPP